MGAPQRNERPVVAAVHESGSPYACNVGRLLYNAPSTAGAVDRPMRGTASLVTVPQGSGSVTLLLTAAHCLAWNADDFAFHHVPKKETTLSGCQNLLFVSATARPTPSPSNRWSPRRG